MTDSSSLPPIKIRWIIGVLAGFLIFVVIAAYSSRMAKDTTDEDQQRSAERMTILEKQRAADNEALTTADWVDRTKSIVRIPVDEAVPQEIALLKTKPVQMGAEIPGSAPTKPATAPAPTGATNSAPAAAAPGTNAAPSAPAKPKKK